MVNLTNVGIGSVVLNMIEDVPATISGATLWNMADNERLFAEKYTGANIGESIADQYQPAIISLTAASVLRSMEMVGADVSNIKLGDFTVGKGASSNVASAGDKMKADGMMKLEMLGQNTNYFKALG